MGVTVNTISGGGGSATTDASELIAGTLDSARLDTDVTVEGNTFNGANQLVKLDGTSKLPAVDGSNLTGLGGGGGTVQDATTKAIKVVTEVGTAGNARGTNAVDLQVTRSSASQVASGASAFQVGMNCTASGVESVAMGRDTSATASRSVALGSFTAASGLYSFASGANTAGSGQSSTALGQSTTASEFYSIAVGGFSVASQRGQFAHSGYKISSSGDSQYSRFVSRWQTTDATPVEMSINSSSILTRITLPSGKTWRFVIELVAKKTSNGDTFAATYVGAIKRVGTATSLVGTVTERDKVNDAGASTWSVAVTADDTNESLKIEVTGAASTTINWCAVVHLTEVA